MAGKTNVILSLGWGVQSFAYALMAQSKEVPVYDCAISASVKYEKSSTKKLIKEWGGKIKRYYEVSNKNDVIERGMVIVPAHVKGGGMLKRRCSREWKIEPIERFRMRVFPSREVKSIICFTKDEEHRIGNRRSSRSKPIYPFVEMGITRQDCINWLEMKGYPIPDKSGCVVCPYQSFSRWQLQTEEEREIAIGVDKDIRRHLGGKELYLRRDCVPVNGDQQLSFYDLEFEECSGSCFL